MSDAKPIEPVSPPDPTIKGPAPIDMPAADGGIAGIGDAAPSPGKALRDKAAKPWFLAEQASKDRMQLRFAAREIDSVVPLVDGKTIFTELENAIDGARSSVLLAYWAINFTTKMVTDSERTWADMLIEAADRGVKVRVVMNDFDPGLQRDSHINVWAEFNQLVSAAYGKAKVSTDALQAVVARHAAEVPAALMGAAVPDVYDGVAVDLNTIPTPQGRKNVYLSAPGLWDKIAFDPKSSTLSPKTAHQPYPAWPASHHQKLAIVDGQVAFTGGVNIVELYVDSSKHERKVDKDGIGPWHDAYIKVAGVEIIRDLVANYVGLWNLGKAAMDAFLAAQSTALGVRPPDYATVKTTALREADIAVGSTSAKTTAPAITAQVRRTFSVANANAPFFSNMLQDVLDGYLLAIGLAEEYIYIENQYFREEQIGKAIIDRHKKASALQTLIVLPTRSEEEVRKKADRISRYGVSLQFDILADMQRQLGSRLGIYAMERADKALVYVHSKLFIVDDKLASIGSANANPRSQHMDSELDIVWYDAASVRDLRLKLWKEQLGSPKDLAKWKPADYVKKWNAVAKANSKARASALQGFVRPFVNDAQGEQGVMNLGPYS